MSSTQSRLVKIAATAATAFVALPLLGAPAQAAAKPFKSVGMMERALYSATPVTTPATSDPTTNETSTQPATTNPSGVRLRNASNTGVPAGVKLTTYKGSLTISTPGAVIDAANITGNLWINADNVTIKRSKVTGVAPSGVQGVITVKAGIKNFVLEDSEVLAGTPDVRLDGVKGAGFTVRRSHIHGGVDNIKVHGDNVVIEDSYIHDTDYFTSDPFQNGGATHNDNIQVLGGNNIRITGNTMRQDAQENASLQVTQDYAALTNFSFTHNNVDGGTCSANFNHKKQVTNLTGFAFTDNTFGRNTKYRNCAFLTTSKVVTDNVRNVYTDGVAVKQNYMAGT